MPFIEIAYEYEYFPGRNLLDPVRPFHKIGVHIPVDPVDFRQIARARKTDVGKIGGRDLDPLEKLLPVIQRPSAIPKATPCSSNRSNVQPVSQPG